MHLCSVFALIVLLEWKYSNYFLLNENYAITIYLILTEDENMTPNFCCVDLQLPVQSVPMTTKIVSSNPSHAGVYSTGRWFSPSTPVSSTNKTDRHDITEILLKWRLTPWTKPYINNSKNHKHLHRFWFIFDFSIKTFFSCPLFISPFYNYYICYFLFCSYPVWSKYNFEYEEKTHCPATPLLTKSMVN
jgi:hypothetical protein